MRINGRLIIISIITLICVVGLNKLIAKDDKSYNDEVIAAFENTLKSEGIEHLRITRKEEDTFDFYRDTINGMDQTDYYDAGGNFIRRDFTTNFGKNMISVSTLGNDEKSKLEGMNTLATPEIENDNYDIANTSIIEHYLTSYNTSIYEEDWKEEKSIDKDIIKYSSRGTYIYIDSNKNEVIKKEIYRGKEPYEVMEIGKIDNNSELGKNLFKVNSPLIFLEVNKNINLDNVDMMYSDLNKDKFVPKGENAKNSVG